MKTNLLIAGGIAALSFIAKYTYQKFFNKNSTIPKQIVIQKLIDTKQNLYTVLFEIAQIVQTRLIPKGLPPDQCKMFILENQQLSFKQQIYQILKQKVYYDITEEDLQYATEQLYKDDKQVLFYKKAFQQEYEKCFLGIKPQPLSTRMLVFNEEKCVNILTRILSSKLQRLRKIVEQIKKEFPQPQNKEEKFARRLEQSLQSDQRQDDLLRTSVLKQYHVRDKKIFEFAVAKLIKESKSFEQKYKQLNQQFKNQVKKILKF